MSELDDGSDLPIVPGAQPQSWEGDRRGALVIHGFTGSPHSVRNVAAALAEDGMSVELPLLPGHGTTVEAMLDTSWDDWSAKVEATYKDLASRTDHMVVVGLSMGGTLAAWVASRFEVDALVVINAALKPQPEVTEFVEALLANGDSTMDAIGSDIKKEDAIEVAYDRTPLEPLRSLGLAIDELQDRIGNIGARVLICRAAEDHVVPPDSAEHFASLLDTHVEWLELDDSYHVATLDNDAEAIETATVRFANEAFNLS